MNREDKIAAVIDAARTVQDFLWGQIEERGYDFELWRKILGKRLAKIDEIDSSEPHAIIELRKRLLQTAAVSVAWLEALDEESEKSLRDFRPGPTYDVNGERVR